MILEGKTVIVTGVGPGLGSEIVRCALRDGANVMLAARGALPRPGGHEELGQVVHVDEPVAVELVPIIVVAIDACTAAAVAPRVAL